MNDQVGVRVLDGAQYLAKQIHARAKRQPALVAIIDDGHARNVFQSEIGLRVVAEAGVDEARYVRVIQAREDFSLARGALRHDFAHQDGVDELESDLAREQAIDARREPHAAHPAVTEQRQDAIGSELPADEERVRFGQRADQVGGRAALEQSLLRAVALKVQQVADDAGRFWIAALEIGQPRLPLVGRHLGWFVEELRHARELLSAEAFQKRAGCAWLVHVRDYYSVPWAPAGPRHGIAALC